MYVFILQVDRDVECCSCGRWGECNEELEILGVYRHLGLAYLAGQDHAISELNLNADELQDQDIRRSKKIGFGFTIGDLDGNNELTYWVDIQKLEEY